MFKLLDLSKVPFVVNKFKAIQEWANGTIAFQQPVTLTSGSTVTWNATNNYNAKVTLTESATLSIIGIDSGSYGTIEVIQGGSGSYTLTLPTAYTNKVSGGGAGVVTLSTAVGKIDILTWYYNGSVLYWNVQTDFT